LETLFPGFLLFKDNPKTYYMGSPYCFWFFIGLMANLPTCEWFSNHIHENY
jgi:hypothetical protein